MAGELDPIACEEQNGHNSSESSHSLSDDEDPEILNTFNNLSISEHQDIDPPKTNGVPNGKKKSKSIFQEQEQPNDTNRKWKPGGQCLAIYSLDGLYYEATILSVDYTKSTAQVKFTYYGNEETVNMKNLLPMESKSEMSIVPNSVYMNGSVGKNFMSSDYDTRYTSNAEQETNRKNNWRISDICFVSNRRGEYEQAVINSFKSIDTCHVTIIATNKRKEVKVTNLYTSIPNNSHKQPPPPPQPQPRKMSNCHCHSGGEVNGYRSDDPPMYIPPPPTTYKQMNPPNIPNPNMMHNSGIPNPNMMHNFGIPNPNMMHNSGIPNPNFVPPFSPWQMSNGHSYNKNPMNSNNNIPKCPPLPVVPDEVIAGDEEALANMLMSWYISGFHTGYYQGMQKTVPKNNHNDFHETNNHRHGSEVRKGPNRRWGNTLV